MRAGAVGCEIIVKGKLSSRRARYQKFRQGTIAKTGEPADIFVDESDDTAILKPGAIGIKVRIMKPDSKLPGIITVKRPKFKPPEEVVLVAPPTEDAVEEEVVEEVMDGITDIEELRELEELDGLELVEEIVDSDKDEDVPAPKDDESEDESEVSDSEIEESTLKELEELDALDEEGE